MGERGNGVTIWESEEEESEDEGEDGVSEDGDRAERQQRESDAALLLYFGVEREMSVGDVFFVRVRGRYHGEQQQQQQQQQQQGGAGGGGGGGPQGTAGDLLYCKVGGSQTSRSSSLIMREPSLGCL